jgi:hypothetical protein
MKALLYWWDEAQHPIAREALKKAGRTDLIGRAASCLVPPDRPVRGQGSGAPDRGGAAPSPRDRPGRRDAKRDRPVH